MSDDDDDDVAQEAAIRQRYADASQLINELLLQRGLYQGVDITTDVGAIVEEILREASNIAFDAYCIGCKRETTFRVQSQQVATRSVGGRFSASVNPPKLIGVRAVCQRDWRAYTYIFAITDKRLTKIGQTPSMADIAHGELRGIDRALEDVDRQELGKALGLFSHDTALGAFVYLRRVFERMVDRAYQRQAAAGENIADSRTMRMNERIAALKNELPDAVVRNSGVFSVLSVGLHDLTEEQCAAHFPVVKAVLFQMLEQEEHKRKAAITARETELALQRIIANPEG
jgi:hypothetical protein